MKMIIIIQYVGDTSRHVNDRMSSAKDLIGGAKDPTDSANTGEHGVG